MKLLATAEHLATAYAALTTAAREYVPAQSGANAVGLHQLMTAAVQFTAELAIEAGGEARDGGQSRGLEDTLIAKLASWVNEAGDLTVRLWTHDLSCVFDGLRQAAYYYAQPRPSWVKGSWTYVMETLPKRLTIAAVTFTIQFALEETNLSAAELRGLEAELIRTLEGPWEIAVPLSVDVKEGPTWESRAETET